MKHKITLIAFILGSIILNPNSLISAEIIGKITFPLGDVYYLHPDSQDWKEVEFNQELTVNTKIKTEVESRCEITLNDGSIIRIGENSILNLGNSTVTAELKIIKPELEKGKVWLNMQELKSSLDKAVLTTPTAVAAIRGTIFRSEADTNAAQFRVYNGKVAVNLNPQIQERIERKEPKIKKPGKIEGPKSKKGPGRVSMLEWLEIVAGEQVIIDNKGKMVKSKFDPEKDAALEWVKWNLERDKSSKH